MKGFSIPLFVYEKSEAKMSRHNLSTKVQSYTETTIIAKLKITRTNLHTKQNIAKVLK